MSMDGATCPSLYQRKEGQPSDEEMLRSHKREAGWFSDSRAKGKPPRMRERMLREISITHPAPPCGDARRGIWLALNSSQVIWTAVPRQEGDRSCRKIVPQF